MRLRFCLLCCVLLAGGSTADAAELRVSGAPALVWDGVLQGDETNRLRWPVAVAAASDREIVVADSFQPRLVVFSRTEDSAGWRAVRAVSLPAAPHSLVFDGIRYVVSLRGKGELLAAEPPELRFRSVPLPVGVTATALAVIGDGELLAYDAAGSRVLRLDSQGRMRSEISVEGHLTALAAAGAGFVAAFPDAGEVRRYDDAGEFTGQWRIPGQEPVPSWPVGLAAQPGGDIVLIDRHGGRILLIQPGDTTAHTGARRGWEPGLLLFPSAVSLLPDGRLAVADQGNGRVQLFRRIDESPTP